MLKSGSFPEVPLLEQDELRQAEVDDSDWHNGQGESPDHSSANALQLAYRALNKFPDLAKRYRYQKFVGTAAVVSSVLVAMATLAVNRRLHRGQSPERILEEITPEEIVSIAKEKKPKRDKARKVISRFIH